MAKISIKPVPRTGKYISITPVDRTGKYVSINPFENELNQGDTNLIGFFDPNNPDLYNQFGNPPPWKGLFGGATQIQFFYNAKYDANLNIIIGDISTGKVVINDIKCSVGDNMSKEITLAGYDFFIHDKIPKYNPIKWEHVQNAGDAIRLFAFQTVDENPIQLISFKLTFNGRVIADTKFDTFLPKYIHITNSEPVYMNDAIYDYCLNQIFYYQNPFLRCAANELGSSWNLKYEGCHWEWYWGLHDNAPISINTGENNGCYLAPKWDSKFICWVLENTDPLHFTNLWSMNPYVTNYFRKYHLYISPYSEVHQLPYHGKVYEDFWKDLGNLIKPGFLASAPEHITMFLCWSDKDGNATEFNPEQKDEPQYFLGIGGNQDNKVSVDVFSIIYNGNDGDADIIWCRKDSYGNRYCVDDDLVNPKEEGFSNPPAPMLADFYRNPSYITNIISRARLFPPGYPYVHVIPEELRYYLALLGYFDDILK